MRSNLLSGRGFAVVVSRYASGARQSIHRDQLSKLSMVLCGGFLEAGPTGTLDLSAGGLLLKSRTVRHEDAFGATGAVLLTVEFEESEWPLAQVDADCWRKRDDTMALRLGVSLVESALARDAISIDAACGDLVVEPPSPKVRRMTAPTWLTRLRDEVETFGLAQVDIALRARDAGVHPAHASRLFRRCFGTSITLHAKAHGVRRAIALMSQPNIALGEVALAAGFYDQSHMNRAFRMVSGRPPGAHRQLLGRAILASGG
jgi:AraC family transcriptional regulator